MLAITTSKSSASKFLYVMLQGKDWNRKFWRIKKTREIKSRVLKYASTIRKKSFFWKRPPLIKHGNILPQTLEQFKEQRHSLR